MHESDGFFHKRCDSWSGDNERKRKLRDSMGAEEITKRKEDPTAFVIVEAINCLKHGITSLVPFAKERNCKKEIKDITVKLEKTVSTLNLSSGRQWLEKNRFDRAETMTFEVDCQTDFKEENKNEKELEEKKNV